MSFLDTAWQAGQIAGPETLAWLRAMPEPQARAHLAELQGAIINPLRRDFGADEGAYAAYLKAAREGRVWIHGGRA